ncbi:hypothetical protein BST36_20415 [Mycolicibacterium moriokaense]|uniref:Uncharacterized protein n=1 Tax=Mycolicibacterium moriokaense TaxID=39691 RepID=A0AAD1M4I6_9MYCO|nr:hypothetical protein [Mycolicibacterium moriokaense]ORB20148.1 hypothetical protein BST36_20415 [Mycolicibacterium moriokaense]BBX00138.1 hypothetical protein MMOR_10740 [Mycolicibacterium moriokaense]
MSWLLVALIPGLLMMATFALDRVEATLSHDTVSASDVAAFLEQAEAVDVNTLARDGMSRAMDSQHRRLNGQGAVPHGRTAVAAPSGLPTRVYVHSAVNPEFRATRQPNRV